MEISKKLIRVLLGAAPLGFIFGMALRIAFTTDGRELKKYDVDNFFTTDTLKRDTLITKEGELYTDTLINYFIISKENIKFKNLTTSYDFQSTGYLSVKSEEITKYNKLEKGVVSREIKKEHHETKRYYLTKNLIRENFKLDSFRLHTYEFSPLAKTLDNSLYLTPIYVRDKEYNINYTKSTKEGKIILSDKKATVIQYLNKIKEHKKMNGTWKD